MLFMEGSLRFPVDFDSEEIVDIIKDPQYKYKPEDLHSFDLR